MSSSACDKCKYTSCWEAKQEGKCPLFSFMKPDKKSKPQKRKKRNNHRKDSDE